MPEESAWYREGFELVESRVNGAHGSRLHAVRKEAYGALAERGLPTSKDEDWKYTSTRDIVDGNFVISSREIVKQVEVKALAPLTIPNLDAFKLVTVNGFVAENLSDNAQDLPEGITLASIADISNGGGDLTAIFDKHFGAYAKFAEDSVAALNTSFVQDGIVLRIAKNASVSTPILIQHVSVSREDATSGGDTAVANFPRLLVVVEEGAKASVIEQYVTLGDSKGFTSSVAEFSVADNANFMHYQVGDESSPEQIRVSRVSATQAKDSQFRTVSLAFGGKLIRNEVMPTLNGTGGFTGMYGLSVLNAKQHVDNHTVLDHAEPHCESDERYKGIYDDKSKGVFCGTIIVRPDAQKTNAIQSNQGLLLSDKASLSTKPQLKIWADDVKCTHGATVGQLDKGQLFYLRSRGIGERDARNMLVQAFAGDVTKEISLQLLREYVEGRVVAKLSLLAE